MQQIAGLNLESIVDQLQDLSVNDRLLIERAYHKAEAAHAGQMRKSGEPYFTHCVAVAHILAEMRLDAEAIAAALMHDLAEDTNITVEEIRNEFGSNIAHIVDGVSKLKKLPIKVDVNKRGKAADKEFEYVRKMLLAMNDDVRVVLVKHGFVEKSLLNLNRNIPILQRFASSINSILFIPTCDSFLILIKTILFSLMMLIGKAYIYNKYFPSCKSLVWGKFVWL